MSINIERILTFKGLTERGLVTLLLLLGVLVVSLARPGARPEPDRPRRGAVGRSIVITVVVGILTLQSRPSGEELSHFTSSLVISAIGTLPFIVAGVSLLADAGGGLSWVLAAPSAPSSARCSTPGSCWSRSCAERARPRDQSGVHRSAAVIASATNRP